MTDTTNTDPDVEINFPWMKAPAVYEEEPAKQKDRLPIPKFSASGRRYLVYQDPEQEKIGRIYVPKDAQQKRRPTAGVIVSIGDGYEDEDRIRSLDEEGEWSPYALGERVMWSKYDDTVVRVPVEDDWWDSAQEKEREQGMINVTVLHVKQVIGILT